MALLTGGEVIVEILKAEGVKFVFGLPGGHTLPIYDGLYHNPQQIRHILVRHEQQAANMAAAYASLTGEPGVCCATAGPGATNIVSGIAEAFYGALPVITLTGRAATPIMYKGAAQEIDQERLFAPITKWCVRVERTDMLPEIMRHAFVLARSGKPGPVLIDLPVEIQMQKIDFATYLPAGPPLRQRADHQLLSAAADKLRRAQRPIIIAGGGTVMSGAFAELRALAESLGLPVLTTLSGRGALPDDHPLACGGLGMHRNALSKKLLQEADVVLGLGCRFEQFETNWMPEWMPPDQACYIQVDADPEEIGKALIPQIGIVGDIKLVLEDMLRPSEQRPDAATHQPFSDVPRIEEISIMKKAVQAEVKKIAARADKPLLAARVVRQARDVLPRNTTMAVDVGCLAQALGGAFPYFDVFEPRSVIPCTSFYCMGYAASALPVAGLVYPDRLAVSFCGDGSFQMIMSVLPAAVEYGLPVTWCVLNDGCLGSIKKSQRSRFEGRYIATSFAVNPDFAAIASACECYGEKVENPEDIQPALLRAIAANKRNQPAVLDFRVSSEGPQAANEYFGVAN